MSLSPFILTLCLLTPPLQKATVLDATSHGQQATAISAPQPDLTGIKKAYQKGQWQQIVDMTASWPNSSPEVDYYRGLALAKLKRWVEARQAFKRGFRKAPRDKRFPTELAGIAFVQKKYAEAKAYLNQTLRLDPHDSYANNFMATIYDLEDNLDAALKYWNRIGMPKVREIRMTPVPRLDPVLLNRAFAFGPDTTLMRSDFLTTQARLAALRIFSQPRMDLRPLEDSSFDVEFIPNERNGWGPGVMAGLLSLLRGAPYDTIYPEFFNLRHQAINFNSLLRWDPNKERVFASFSSPFEESARWRYQVYLDGRRERWDLANTFFGSSQPVGNLQLEKIEGGAQIESITNGRISWASGLDFSGRTFRNASWNNPTAASFFKNGFALEYRSGIKALLLDVPERRFTLDSTGDLQFGKLFVRDSSPFLQTEGGLLARWFPQAQGDDYAMTARLRAGKTWGTVPFDDLFILGLERDNDLWMRAHIGTSH
ncbi:MAG TPA: tetratricopeptide repeat protein, partial [Terriglobia bacterium]|nr:tetratricopeptide repeat protein [Terriglobia bacterium]